MIGTRSRFTSGNPFLSFISRIHSMFSIRCLTHIFNLAVTDILKVLTKEAPESEAAASTTSYSEADLTDPVVALRGLISAVSGLLFYVLVLTV